MDEYRDLEQKSTEELQALKNRLVEGRKAKHPQDQIENRDRPAGEAEDQLVMEIDRILVARRGRS